MVAFPPFKDLCICVFKRLIERERGAFPGHSLVAAVTRAGVRLKSHLNAPHACRGPDVCAIFRCSPSWELDCKWSS